MVKQAGLSTPVLGEVLTNLAPLRMKHSASVPAYHKGKPTWLFLYFFACALTHLAILTLCKGNRIKSDPFRGFRLGVSSILLDSFLIVPS